MTIRRVTDEDWPAVGMAVSTRMRQRRMTQQGLAAASGVSVATLRELQRGTSSRRAQDATLTAISRALGWPDDHLLTVLLGRTPDEVPLRPLPVDQQILEVLLRIERGVAEIGAQLRQPAYARPTVAAGHDSGPDPAAQ